MAPGKDDLIQVEQELLDLMTALTQLEREHRIRKGFNLFEALNITRQEIRHSRFLAYLLDPNETHGLGDQFLRAILRTTIGDDSQCPVSRLDVELKDLSDAAVYCERDHFDITVQIPELELLFVIENKVGAAESEAQLVTYRKRAQERYGEYRFLGCFLTPDGYEGADESWFTLSYGAVCEVLTRILGQEALAEDVTIAIKHYIELVQRRIMASPELVRACREIYLKHRAAFDLIVEHGQQSALGTAFDQFAAAHPGLAVTTLRSEAVFFHHESWLQLPGRPVADRVAGWTSDFPVRFWFRVEANRLVLCLQMGPILSPSAENSWIALFEALAQKFEVKRAPRSTRRARVARVNIELQDDSVQELLDAMNKAWSKLANGEASESVRSAVQEWVEGREMASSSR
ncbi:PD-(D/E)XK nuclease family protein [Achromobacter xylosoxidans]